MPPPEDGLIRNTFSTRVHGHQEQHTAAADAPAPRALGCQGRCPRLRHRRQLHRGWAPPAPPQSGHIIFPHLPLRQGHTQPCPQSASPGRGAHAPSSLAVGDSDMGPVTGHPMHQLRGRPPSTPDQNHHIMSSLGAEDRTLSLSQQPKSTAAPTLPSAASSAPVQVTRWHRPSPKPAPIPKRVPSPVKLHLIAFLNGPAFSSGSILKPPAL